MAKIICKNCKQEKKVNRNYYVFCGAECRNEFQKKQRLERDRQLTKECRQCGEAFVGRDESSQFCSIKCSTDSLKVYYERTCQLCGKVFFVKNIHEIKRGDHKFCSYECSQKKFHFDDVNFLTDQNAEKIYWLGFMFASIVHIDNESITFSDTPEMIQKLKNFFNATMPINNKGNSSKIIFFSRSFSANLRIIGLRIDYYKEAPLIRREFVKDFIRGFFDSRRGYIYRDKGQIVVAIHGEDSKLMRWIADMLSARLVYKAGEWIAICNDFNINCNGLPKNNSKWKKFGTGPNIIRL